MQTEALLYFVLFLLLLILYSCVIGDLIVHQTRIVGKGGLWVKADCGYCHLFISTKHPPLNHAMYCTYK